MTVSEHCSRLAWHMIIGSIPGDLLSVMLKSLAGAAVRARTDTLQGSSHGQPA